MTRNPIKYNVEIAKRVLYRRKELWIRYVSVFVIGTLMPVIYQDIELFTHDYFVAISVSILRTGILWGGSEFIVDLILNRYDIFQKTAKTLTILAITLISFTLLIITLEFLVLENFTDYVYTWREKLFFYEEACIITLFITTLYASTFFFISWRENLLKAEKLEKATIEAKYETLRNQVNPHFLFNSLNTLVGMLNENSEELKYVQNLSNFLRYVLQTSEKELVLLGDELEFSRQYAFIQQKRFKRKLTIQFEIGVDAYGYELPPLSLQMLIENAIKHNVISIERPLAIIIYTRDQKLVVENNLQRKEIENSTGLGLENIRNRYKYLGSDSVEIKETHDKFSVKLPLLKVNV